MRRVSANRLTRLAMVLAGLGIACGQQPKPGVQAASPNQSRTAMLSTATKQASLFDPVLQVAAYSLKVPGDWNFSGTVLPGPSCNPVPYAIYRAESPDGITLMKALPGLTWSWGGQPPPSAPGMPAQKNDCSGWSQEISAADFLKYMVGVLRVKFVRDEPVAPQVAAGIAEAVRKQNAGFAAQTPPGRPFPFRITRREMAVGIVRYNINTIPVEERLTVMITCNESPQVLLSGGWAHGHLCSTDIARWRTRQGSLEALTPVFMAAAESATVNQQWLQRWNQALLADAAAARGTAVAGQALLQRTHTEMMEAQEMRKQQHEEMMAVTQRGTAMAMKQDAEQVGATSRMSHDWADFALDQQKRLDPNTGQITKDSSLYSYTWVNEFGERKQTDDINYNPNGLLRGNWTLQTNIR